MAKFTLVSFELCPYVQRVAIALAEKGVAFDLVYVDLANKPDWFVALSPLGKVPLLKIEDDGRSTVLFESSVILEYLEDINIGEPLHPAEPLAKARSRAWMEFGSSLLGDIWGLETATSEQAHQTSLGRIRAKLAILERELDGRGWFNKEGFGLVDAVFGPAFRYFDVFDLYFATPLTDDFPKISAWRAALAARDSIANAVVPDYARRLKSFLVDKNAWMLTGAHEPVQS